jgi:DNA-binding NtrC family response regulator
MAEFNRELGRNITNLDDLTERILIEHTWPGNVRELRNVIRQAMVVAHGETLVPAFLPSLYSIVTSSEAGAIDVDQSTAQSTSSVSAPSSWSSRSLVPSAAMSDRERLLAASEAEITVIPRSELNEPGKDDFSRCISVILRRHQDSAYARALRALDERIVKLALEAHDGNISAAARHLGITRVTLRRKMRENEHRGQSTSHAANQPRPPAPPAPSADERGHGIEALESD